MSSEKALDVKSSGYNATQLELELQSEIGSDKESSSIHRVVRRSSTESTLSKNKLINLILSKLSDVKEEHTLVYHVDLSTAEAVIKELDRLKENRTLRLCYNSRLETLKFVLMPSQIRDSHQPWLNNSIRSWSLNGLLLPQEADDLFVLSSTRFSSFRPPYTSSRKEPDQCIRPLGMSLPTLVVESGWTESRPQLHHDRDLWLFGGAGSVQVVIILKWAKNSQGQVKGDLEVFDLDPFQNVQSLQRETIFPPPHPTIAATQFIQITRSQLYGPSLPAGQNPTMLFPLALNELRRIADVFIRDEGYVPIL